MIPELIGQDLPGVNRLGVWVINILAIAGAAAMGWFGMALLVRIATRWLTSRPLPQSIRTVLKALAAAVLGWVVALWLFGTGGLGWGGGGGGWGLGGTGKEGKGEDQAPRTVEPKDAGKNHEPSSSPSNDLRIEVLKDPERSRTLYRLEENRKLVNGAEIKDRIAEGIKKQPPLKRLVIILYDNSPDESTPAVRELRNLAAESKLDVVLEQKKGYAPSQ